MLRSYDITQHSPLKQALSSPLSVKSQLDFHSASKNSQLLRKIFRSRGYNSIFEAAPVLAVPVLAEQERLLLTHKKWQISLAEAGGREARGEAVDTYINT